MAIHKLTPLKVKKATHGKYEDGGGLRLVVSPRLAKKWIFRFTIDGKRREMGLGSFPDVSLGEAREKANRGRQMVSEGIDSILNRQSSSAGIPSLTTCAAGYILAHRSSWKNAKHARQWVSTLKTYARPVFGDKAVASITTEDVLAALKPIWTNKTETAKRVQGRIENILDYAAAHNYRDPLNPARWKGHLDKLLPRPSRVKKVTHHPAMPFSGVPKFMAELLQFEGISAKALSFLILTATRTNEVLQTQRIEIDFKAEIWIIPSSRMKSGRTHRVPLSKQALAVLKSVPRIVGNPYLFPGSRDRQPLSNMPLLKQMRDIGYGVNGKRGNYVPHGFRSSFRDWSGEV